MRMPKFYLGRAGLLGICVCGLLSLPATGQDLIPTSLWNVESGDWSDAGSWDPEGPSDERVAGIRNGGTADFSGDDTVHAFSVVGGTLNLESGTLTADNEATLGGDGVISFSGGTFTADVFGMTGGTIDVASSVAGALDAGATVPLFTAGRIGGAPANVTVDGAAPSLADGLRLSYITNDDGGAVTVESLPTMMVDRLDGSVQLVNGAMPMDIKGYSIASPNGLLSKGSRFYDSLEDQDLPGWDEANPEVDLLSEFILEGSAALTAGQVLDLGTPYASGIGVKPNEEQLSWQYLTGDGRILDGLVEYSGPLGDIVLSIDPDTGAAEIRHDSPLVADLDIIGITLSSDSGSLDSGDYDGFGWDISPNNDDRVITEISLNESMLFTAGVAQSLGEIFDTDGDRDVSFRYALSNGSTTTGTVVYGVDFDEVNNDVCAPVNALVGDLDGDGSVGFTDFLALSTNFGRMLDGTAGDYALGDINCDAAVNFNDFLALSTNFGQTLPAGASAAASVPEPSGAILFFLGILGMMKFRKRGRHVALAVAAVAVMGVASQDTYAQFSGRYVRIHPQGANAGINSVTEFQQILNGERTDVIINEDFTFELDDVVDFGGGDGGFPDFTLPYPEGPNETIDADMNNFGIVLTAEVTIPAGDYALACGSDDGCWFRIDGVEFEETFNEAGAVEDGDDEVLFNNPRGHQFTTGNFSLSSDLETTMIAGFFEAGGGDSFELVVWDEHFEEGNVWTSDANNPDGIGFELSPGELGWEIEPGDFTGADFNPADLNRDGVVDLDDEKRIDPNFGTNDPDGDIDGNGRVGLEDVWLLSQALAAANPGAGATAATVPEPSGFIVAFFAMIGLLGARRRR